LVFESACGLYAVIVYVQFTQAFLLTIYSNMSHFQLSFRIAQYK